MPALLSRPKTVYLLLGVAIVAFFALSAVGHTGTSGENEASSVAWIGSIGWAGFLLSLLALIAYSLGLLVHRLRTRRSSDGHLDPLLRERT